VPEPDLTVLFVRPLEEAGLDRYMVSGSIAAIEYGEPRATLDVDVAIRVAEASAASFREIFPAPDYDCPPVEILQLEAKRPARGHFNVIHVGSGLKADFYPSQSHPYFEWAMSNRRRLTIGEGAFWFAPPEYVILWKLEFYREGKEDKHLRDVRGMMAVSGGAMDRDLLERAVCELRLETEWKAAQA